MIAFIDTYRERLEVRVHSLLRYIGGGFIAARRYRAAKKRLPSKHSLRDCELIPITTDIHQQNYGVYGVCKSVARIACAGHDLGHDQIARLMKIAGHHDVVLGRY